MPFSYQFTNQSLFRNHLLSNNFMFFSGLHCKHHLLFQILYSSSVMTVVWNLCFGAQWINIIENSSFLATLHCGTFVGKPCNAWHTFDRVPFLNLVLIVFSEPNAFSHEKVYDFNILNAIHFIVFFFSFQLWQTPLPPLMLFETSHNPQWLLFHIFWSNFAGFNILNCLSKVMVKPIYYCSIYFPTEYALKLCSACILPSYIPHQTCLHEQFQWTNLQD